MPCGTKKPCVGQVACPKGEQLPDEKHPYNYDTVQQQPLNIPKEQL